VRLAAVLPAVAAALALAACGGDGATGDTANRAGSALSYLGSDTSVIALVTTDLESEQVRSLDENVVRPLGESGLEEQLRRIADDSGISYENDVKPLLGNDVAIGVVERPASGEEGDLTFVAALETKDAERLREVANRIAFFEPAGEEGGATLYRITQSTAFAAVEDDVFVIGDTRETLERALARRDGGDGLDDDAVGARLTDLPGDAAIRVAGETDVLLRRDALDQFSDLPWIAALRSFGVAISADEGELRIDATLNTDPDDVNEDDLPLATGDDTPEVLDRDREIAGANSNQSQTTVFLLRAARAAYPESRFVREVDALEEELGIDFEQEILRQFDGPSVSAVSPDGRRFAARSEVSDPEELARAMRALAPRLPALIEGLQGLESEGLALLFLLAPDAPIATTRLAQVNLEEPADDDGFYHVSGLTGDGPSDLYFGVVDDYFVVASDEESARAIADEETIEAEGAQGTGVLRADLAALADEAEERLGFPAASFSELVGSLEASEERLRARLRVEFR
jgi:hypothetical protein